MVLKFVELFDNLFPKGKAWDENQENITKLKAGLSDEFGRVYDDITTFYKNFNIIKKFELSKIHGKDYLLDIDKFSNSEIQHIIVEYIYGNYTMNELIDDFATFIGANITFLTPSPPITFTYEFPAEFGDVTVGTNMQVFVEFADGTSCENYGKIVYLVNFFKPPYLLVGFSNKPIGGSKLFEMGTSKFGEGFGTQVVCEL